MATMRGSLVRLMRTPVKTAFFFLLLAFTVALVCAGGNLWKLCGDNLAQFETIFTTIGTVEQMPEKIVQTEIWEADKKAYRYRNTPVYGETVSSDVLNFEGGLYLSGPEQRAYYEALPLQYELKEDYEGYWQYMVIEASPLEDCVPAGPVKIEVKRVLYSVYPVNTSPIYLCDHNTEHPRKLFADKTYLMALGQDLPHDWRENSVSSPEYTPIDGPRSTQADRDGNRLPTELTGDWLAEVTPGFYDTKEGEDWLRLCEDFALRNAANLFFPVTATKDLNLVMAFYTKQAYLSEGEFFSEEDYRQGNKVCLVPDRFAVRNHLKTGDSLHLALCYANYATSPGRGGAEGYLNAAGGIYEPFEESDYIIKGIYEVGVGQDGDWGYQLDRNEVFIPTASIKNSDENNIALYGPMKGYTTAFRIPNGSKSIEDYKALWEAQGVDNVEITFYDGGYTKLEGGLKNMRNMSFILLATGIVGAVCIVIFFCHLFITKQKKRTAIERGLGMTKGQCVRSLLTGILVIALVGSAAGAFGGQVFAGRAAAGMEETALFDTCFSNGAVQLERERKESDSGNADAVGAETAPGSVYLTETDWRISAVCGGGVFLFTLAAALAGICRNLKREPLALLAEAGK